MARKQKVAAPKRREFAELAAKVTRVDPPQIASVDAYGWCQCDDGYTYMAKKTDRHQWVHHAEWFCTELAHAIGIPTIAHRVLEMPAAMAPSPRERYLFGSKYEPGELRQLVPPGPNWWELVQHGTVPLADVVPLLSRIYGFDHFIHNIDRHLFNFFVRNGHAGGIDILAFDYSRAWTYKGFPLKSLPFDLNDLEQKTVKAQRDLTRFWGSWVDASAVDTIVASIKGVKKQDIKLIIDKHPKEWLSDAKKRAIIKWWGSREFFERLDGVSAGVKNGAYL
jgi:HipA-like kinase